MFLLLRSATLAAAISESQIESVRWLPDAKDDDPASLVNAAKWDGDESALYNIPAKQAGEHGGHANDEEVGPEPEAQDLVRDGTEDEPDYYGMTKTQAHKDFGKLWVRRAWRRCFFFDCHGALRFVWSDWHCGCGYSQKLWRYCVRLQNRLSWRRYWNYYRFMRCGSFLPFGGPGAWWSRFGPCGNCVWCRHHPRPIIVVKKVVAAAEVAAPKASWPAPAPWAPAPGVCQKEYMTCGGTYAGPNAKNPCCPGLKCVKCNQWYSQCRYDDQCVPPAPAPWSPSGPSHLA